jgi:K+-transporting ATPase ATPase C chain
MKALRMFIWMGILTGLIYPLLVTGVAQLMMPKKANGSLLHHDHRFVGSALIGQSFQGKTYFWPRPSYVDYNPLPSGGSNWGPTSALLQENVKKRKKEMMTSFSMEEEKEIPSELLFNSASGLDPHISPECAHFQAKRIAQERQIDREWIEALIAEHTEKRGVGFLGLPCVNVLKLNLALDKRREP